MDNLTFSHTSIKVENKLLICKSSFQSLNISFKIIEWVKSVWLHQYKPYSDSSWLEIITHDLSIL